MNKDSLPVKIFVAVEAALVVLARVLKGTFPTLCIVLYSIFGILLVVGLGWYIVSLVRHGVPAEEEPKQTPKWRSLLFAVCAMMIIVGTVFRINHWPGAVPMLFIGMVLSLGIFAAEVFDYLKQNK